MRKLNWLFERLLSALPKRRMVQFVELALSPIGEVSYIRLAENGFRPNGIIDIGAYHGDWSRLIAGIYSQVPILMIEAQAEKRLQLEAVCAELPQTEFEMCLLGGKENTDVPFSVMETGSSIYSERSNANRTWRTLPMRTLDRVLDNHPQLKAPLFIKLDVQGAEVDVLTGGTRALAMAEIVQLEVALMNYNEGAPDINAVMNFMASRDFLFFDICGFIRPDPKYLSQLDVLFVRKNSSLRRDLFTF